MDECNYSDGCQIDAREKFPHPVEEEQVGFGLAGGGYGPYSYCGACGKMLHKSQVED